MCWRVLVRELHRVGGGPAPRARFDAHEPAALKRAHDLGLIEHATRRTWLLTEHGRDWCEGRLAMIEKRGGPGAHGHRLVATWLASLPRPAQVVLCQTAHPHKLDDQPWH